MHFDRLIRNDTGRAEADVGRAVLQAGQHFLDRHVVEADVDAGMAVVVSGDEFRQQRAGERFGGRDTHQPAAEFFQIGQIVERLVQA